MMVYKDYSADSDAVNLLEWMVMKHSQNEMKGRRHSQYQIKIFHSLLPLNIFRHIEKLRHNIFVQKTLGSFNYAR